jgi:hypothetical protein
MDLLFLLFPSGHQVQERALRMSASSSEESEEGTSQKGAEDKPQTTRGAEWSPEMRAYLEVIQRLEAGKKQED